ncbi:MAG: hypothetical protein WC322_05725 [Candidatus Paceibacterota bacterium]|jgi:hypothetical protein
MLDREKYEKVLTGDAFDRTSKGLNGDLALMTVPELLTLRSEIDQRLPATALRDMDLERELVLQYQRVVALQDDVMADSDTPANQRAQVSNSVAATLQHLVTMQSKFHTAERLKEIESRLIKALNKLPDGTVAEFFEWYESDELE